LYKEIAFKTNYDEELKVMLLVDVSGILSHVTVFFGIGNVKAIPNDLVIHGIEGIW
jgi:hypothetical protein